VKNMNEAILEQLIGDCKNFVDNAWDWFKTEDKKMIKEAIENIKKDIEMLEGVKK